MSSGRLIRLIQRPLSDGEELKRAEKLKKPGQSTEGRLDPGNAVIAEVRTSLNISDFQQMTSKIKSGK
jgi:hypothetical protein